MQFQSYSQAKQALAASWRWPNFSLAELACRCAGRFCQGAYWHDPRFLDQLQSLRDRIGNPLILTSAHRCALWNAAVGGAPYSRHKRLAVDISLRGQDRHALLQAAQQVGFTGLGLAKTFLHLDDRQRPATWLYPGSKALWVM